MGAPANQNWRSRLYRGERRKASSRWLRRASRFESLEPRTLLTADLVSNLCSHAPLLSRLDSVGAEGEGNGEELAVRLLVTDLAGAPLSTLAPGQEFLLRATLQDLRTTVPITGVFAAYFDVQYPPSLVAPVLDAANRLGFDIRFGPNYVNGISGAVAGGGTIDEVGSFQTGTRPLGPAEQLQFDVHFRAGGYTLSDDSFGGIAEDSVDAVLDVLANDQAADGVATFTGNPADIYPAHEVLFFDPVTAVDPSLIRFDPVSVNVQGGATLRITDVSRPSAGGTAGISASGQALLYTPAQDFVGTETFTYTVGGTATATVTVTVDPVNDAPVAVDDAYTLDRNATFTADATRGVLANDSDVEGDPLTARLVTPPQHGSLTLGSGGDLAYTPDRDFRGTDQFVYVANDGQLDSSPATVTLAIDPFLVGLQLTATDLSGNPITAVGRDQAFAIQATVQDLRDSGDAGVFAAYLDLTYDPQDLTVRTDPANPLGFDVQFLSGYGNNPSGTLDSPGHINDVGASQTGNQAPGGGALPVLRVVVEPAIGQANDDRITGIPEDAVDASLDVLSNDTSDRATTRYGVEGAGNSPLRDIMLYSPRVAVDENDVVFTGGELDLLPADLVITSVGAPSRGGQVRIAPDNKHVLYSPAPDYFGEESFSYTIGHGITATAIVVVDPVNDAPRVADDAYLVQENRALRIDAADGVLANDRDPEQDPITAEIADQPAHGSVSLDPDGAFVYVPESNFLGQDTFTYRAGDGQLTSAIATVRLELTPAPVRLRLATRDPQGNPLPEVRVGDPFDLAALVQDQRSGAAAPGVSAAYVDVIYSADTLQPSMSAGEPLGFDISFGAGYSPSGTGSAATAGLLDEVGSYQSGSDPLGSQERTLFRAGFSATAARAADDQFVVSHLSQVNRLDVLANDRQLVWTSDFQADPADIEPDSDVRLFDPPSVVPDEDIHYEGTQITIRNRAVLEIAQAGPSHEGGAVVVDATRQVVIYTPPAGFVGVDTFEYTLQDDQGHTATSTVSIDVRPSWQNLWLAMDVNSDGMVTPIDALQGINRLNRVDAGPLSDPPLVPPFVDVNGDSSHTPVDVLIVINYLNRVGAGEGEGLAGTASLPDVPVASNGSSSVSSMSEVFSGADTRLTGKAGINADWINSLLDDGWGDWFDLLAQDAAQARHGRRWN